MNNSNHDERLDTSWEGWDDQEVWSNINEALEKKSKRRLLPLFFFIGMTAFISVSILVNQTKLKSAFKPIKPNTQNIQNEKFTTYPTFDDELCPTLKVPSQISQINAIFDATDVNSAINKKTKNNTKVSNKFLKVIKKDVDRNLKQPILTPSQNVNYVQNEEEHVYLASHKYNNIVASIGQIPWQLLTSNIVNKNQIGDKLQVKPSFINAPKRPNKSKFDLYFDQGIGFGRAKEIVDINIPWQNLMHENEQNLYTAIHQIQGVKTFKNGWNISTGLSYLRHISNFKGSTQTISTVAFDSDSARVQQIDGLTYYHGGQLTKTITKNEVYDVFNTHSIIQVPIQIGYALHLKNKTFRIAIGTNYTIAQTIKGYTYEGPDQIVSYSLLSKQKIIKSSGFNELTSSVNLLHPLTNKIGINTGFEISVPTKPSLIISDGQSKDYQRSNTMFFIKLGIVYNIKNH